jgi:hypothetical protein
MREIPGSQKANTAGKSQRRTPLKSKMAIPIIFMEAA